MKFLKNVDLTNNQLTNVALQNLASDGTPTTYGLIWYNTATNLIKYNAGNGSTVIRHLLHDGLLAAASGIATLDASSRVVQAANLVWDGVGNRSASATPGNNTVVVAGGTGKLAYGWFPTMDLLFGNAAPAASVSFNSQRITNVLCDNASAATDAATRGYVDTMVQGLKAKGSVRLATTGSETYTVTAGAVVNITGTTIDGVAVVVNDRILVKDAPAASGPGSAGSSQPGNGIYYVTSAAGPILLTRATDMDTWAEVPNAYAWIEEGTQADTAYVCTSNAGGTLNSTAITFTKFATNNGSATNLLAGAANQIPYQTGPGATGFISAAANAVLATNGSNVPSLVTTLPAVNGSNLTNLTGANVSGNIPGNAANVTGTVAIGNGGTGQTTAQLAINALVGSVAAGNFLRSNGTNAVMTTITAADVPGVAGGGANQILYQTAANTTSFIAAAANSILVSNGSNQPSMSRALPALFQIATSATVAAAGANQGTATALTTDFNVVTTVAASTGVSLPVAVAGMRVTVVNKGANILSIYPATGGTIDALGANAAISCPVNGMLEFVASSTTQWYSTTNTVIPGVGSAANLTGGNTNTVVYQSATGTTAYLANAAQAAVMIQSAGGAAPSWSQYLPTANLPAFTGGDVTSTAGSATLAIGANKVTLAQMATVATATILGRTTAGTGNVEALSASQARTVIGATTKVAATWLNADGATKSIAHNLGTLDVQVSVYDSVSAGGQQVFCDVTLTDTNNVSISAAAAPGVSYRVVIIG